MTHPTDALRLVPVEPTEAMLWRGFDAKAAMTGLRHIHLIYRAMLAAAPAVQPAAGREEIAPMTDLEKLEAPSEDQIKHAVRRAESRFFGTRHLSEQEHLAVDTLVRAASALSAARASARRDAEEIEKLRAPLPGGGWQDISTAPKDGTPLLAGSIHHSDREVVCWQDGLPSGSVIGTTNPEAPEEGWVNDGPHKDRFYANPRYFTHWQPLPAAPTGDAT